MATLTMTTKLSALVEIFQCVENVSKVDVSGGGRLHGSGCFDWVLLSASSHTKAWTVIHIIITRSRIGKTGEVEEGQGQGRGGSTYASVRKFEMANQ